MLSAEAQGKVFLRFSDDLPPSKWLLGETRGNSALIYMRNTSRGGSWDQLGLSVGGVERTGQIGLHEGLHGLGVGGSRRAEALVRLEELRSMGVPMGRPAMRQVLTDMSSNYDQFRWRVGRTSEYFPGLEF